MPAEHTLVLLPGLLNDPTLWDVQRRELSDLAEIVTPSFGESGSLTALATDVLAQAPPRFALAGFSMGGYVALEIFKLAPHRLEGIALLASSALPDTPAQHDARLATIAALNAGKFEKIVAAVAHTAVFGDGPHAEMARESLKAMAQGVGPRIFLSHVKAILDRGRYIDCLSLVGCPAVVVAGRHDAVIPAGALAATAAAIPKARLEVLEDTGHMLPLEAARELSAVLRTWLEQVWRFA